MEESTCAEIPDVKEHVTRVECSEEFSKKLEGPHDINETEVQNENRYEVNRNAKLDGDSVSYLERCKNICRNELILAVIDQFDKEGLLIHFMAFMNMISTGQLSIVNIAVLLSMEVVLLFSLATTTQMKYRDDTSLFFEVVLAVRGPRTLWLFISDKHTGLVNSGECMKSRYEPNEGSFNFVGPDERLLRKSWTDLPKVIKCGIIHESIELLNLDKEFVLSVDGKQTSPGLLNESERGCKLMGIWRSTFCWRKFEMSKASRNVIIEVVNKASREESDLKGVVKDLKIIVHVITKRIKNLREAKVRYEQLWKRFEKKITMQPDIGSKYSVAISEIDCFIKRANDTIKKLLETNVKWCYIMSKINGNEHCFRKWGPILLDSLWILGYWEILILYNLINFWRSFQNIWNKEQIYGWIWEIKVL